MKQQEEIWIMKHLQSQYGVIDIIEDEIASCTIPGFDFVQISRNNHQFQTRMNHLHQDLISLRARYAVNHIIADDFLYDLYGVPHISYLLDSISHFPSLFNRKAPLTSVVAFVDGDSSALYNRQNGEKSALWIPHAVDPKKIEKKLQEGGIWNIPYEERQYDIVISSSWIDWRREEEFWKRNMSSFSYHIMQEIAQKVLLGETKTNHLPILSQFLEEEEGFREEMEKLFGLDMTPLFTSLEVYIRGVDRERVCSLLNDSHASVLILTHQSTTENWRNCFSNNQKIEIRADAKYEETWNYFAQSKVVINSVPTIKKGTHERLLAALFCGAKVLSTYSSLIPEEEEWQKICPSLETLNSEEKLKSILQEPYIVEKVLKVQSWVQKNHSWQRRLEEAWPLLMAKVEEIRLKRELLLNG